MAGWDAVALARSALAGLERQRAVPGQCGEPQHHTAAAGPQPLRQLALGSALALGRADLFGGGGAAQRQSVALSLSAWALRGQARGAGALCAVVISTGAVGVDRNGNVQVYVPPRVVAVAGGGGGPGPLLQSMVVSAGLTLTAGWTFWAAPTLALPAGTFDVWATIWIIGTSAGAASASLAVSLDGTTPIAGSLTSPDGFQTGANINCPTQPVEVVLTAPQTIHAGGNLVFGTFNVMSCQLFARRLA